MLRKAIKKIVILISIFILWISQGSYAQDPALLQRLVGKTKLAEIMNEVDDYYRNEIDFGASVVNNNKKRAYKKWKRWEWFHTARLSPDGALEDASAKILEALSAETNLSSRFNDDGTVADATNNGNWVSIGPTSTSASSISYLRGIGRVDRITFHPTNPLIYYACTPAGGLWRTTNDGLNWQNLSDALPSMGISGMVVSNTNPNILYILTGDGDSNIGGFVEGFGYIRWSQGVFKSTDAGTTWQRMGSFPGVPNFYTGFKLVQCPLNSNFLYAATSRGIFRTLDGGVTWTSAGPDSTYHDVEFKPGSTVAYAVQRWNDRSLFVRSNNANEDFTSQTILNLPGSNNSANDVIRYAIAVTNANTEHVMLLAGPSVGSTGFVGIFRSLDGGNSFQARANTPNILGVTVDGNSNIHQASYDLCIAIAHNDFQKVITGGLCVWRSVNAGSSLQAVTKYFESTVAAQEYIHPDVHDVAYNPLNNVLYACTDGGLYKSTNHGDNWTNLSSGLVISQYYHLAGSINDETKLLGGLQDNGTLYRKSTSSTYTHIRGADGFNVAIHPNNSNKIYWTENEKIYKSNDGGEASRMGVLPVSTNVFFPSFVLNPINHSTIYIGTGHNLSGFQKNVFYRSDDEGLTYIDSTTINITEGIACAPSDVNVFYGTDGVQLFRTQNQGFSFSNRSSNLPAGRRITSISVNPNNSSVVVVTLGGFTEGQKVYFTSDAGLNWINLSGTLPNVPITASAINTNGDVYIGTDIGVFYQADAEVDWRPFYNGLPRVPITQLIIYPDTDKIRAATFGRGLWEASLYVGCPLFYTLSDNIVLPKTYSSVISINSTQNVSGSAGVNVVYKAGTSISLNPGFTAIAGSVMDASIGNCLPGINPVTSARNNKMSGAIKVPALPASETQPDGPKRVYN